VSGGFLVTLLQRGSGDIDGKTACGPL